MIIDGFPIKKKDNDEWVCDHGTGGIGGSIDTNRHAREHINQCSQLWVLRWLSTENRLCVTGNIDHNWQMRKTETRISRYVTLLLLFTMINTIAGRGGCEALHTTNTLTWDEGTWQNRLIFSITFGGRDELQRHMMMCGRRPQARSSRTDAWKIETD